MLKITLADTDALYCSKPTSSHQSGVFLGSFSEIGGLFPGTNIKIDLDVEDILHNLVRHFVGGKSYYEKDGGGSSITLSQSWLAKQCSDLETAFTGRKNIVCNATLNVSTQKRVYLTGLASLRDGAGVLKLKNMLFSGDDVFIYKAKDVFKLRFFESPSLEHTEDEKQRNLLELAIRLFVERRGIAEADGGWRESGRKVNSMVREYFSPLTDVRIASFDEKQIAELFCGKKDSSGKVVFEPMWSGNPGSGWSHIKPSSADEIQEVRDFLVLLRNDVGASAEFRSDDFKHPKGFGPAVVSELLMKFHPEACFKYGHTTYDVFSWLGLLDFAHPFRNDFSESDYKQACGVAAMILGKMSDIKISRQINADGSDDPMPPDYLTVNEFVWFVEKNKNLIKEALMKQQLKKPTAEKKAGEKKLKEILSSKSDDVMNRLVAALQTKPFAILAGASGTGKSRMAKKLAYMMCLNKDLQPSVDASGKSKPIENFIIIPVKPNWHDSSDLLGYRSAIEEKGYQTTPFINFIIKAHCFPDTPFIACLDEMNLAPVEHYFAEYLSASEGTIEDAESGQSVSYPLIEPAHFDNDASNLQLDGYALPQATKELIERVGLVIPKNLFIVGTVNMDDSTDQMSRKVLDRAMTIEMNKVDYALLQSANYEKITLDNLLLCEEDINHFAHRKTYDPEKLKGDFFTMLEEIKKVLEQSPFAVGYRFGIESTLYRDALEKLPLKGENGSDAPVDKIAIDHMILMKVLPRIVGTVTERANLLNGLKNYFKTYLEDAGLSKKALERMEKAAGSNGGYLSFWP